MGNLANLKFDDELAKNLADGVRITFETMFGLSPQAQPYSIESGPQCEGDISGIVSLTQEGIDAVCLISFPRQTILSILEKVYKKKLHSHEESSVVQGVGELANIINGVVKTKMNERGLRLRMGLPNVIVGRAHVVMTQPLPSMKMPFQMDGLSFTVVLTLNRAESAKAA